MLIPFMGPDISHIFSLVATVFLIWMLIHCVRNNSLRYKVWWILFILLLQPIGGIVYFFARGPWSRVNNYLSRLGTPTYQAPPAPKVTREAYPSYEQGYPAQQPEPVPTFQENEQPIYMPSSLQPQYEEPQVTYPEEPPLQQF
jgi:hypothetical protein